MRQSVLIIGGSGFIGKNLIDRLLNDNYSVFNYDLNDIHINHINYSFIKKNTSTQIDDIDLIISYRFKYIFFLASTLLPSSKLEDYLYEMSNLGNFYASFLDRIKASRETKFIYLSSGGCVYGNNLLNVNNEDANCNPSSLYGLKHLYFEKILTHYSQFGLQYLILRPTNPFGRYQNPQSGIGLITKILHDAFEHKETIIWGHPHSVRDYIPIEEMCKVILEIMPNIANEIINIGSGVKLTIIEVINLISKNINTPVNYLINNSVAALASDNTVDLTKLYGLSNLRINHLDGYLINYWLDIKNTK